MAMTRQIYSELQELYVKEGRAVSSNIADVLFYENSLDRNTLTAAAYVLYRAQEKDVDVSSADAFCSSIQASQSRREFLEKSLSSVCQGRAWAILSSLNGRYSLSALKSIILFCRERNSRFGEFATPASISRLACRLFNFEDGVEAADFGIGTASFAIEAFLSNSTIRIHGIDLDESAAEIAAMRLEVLGCPAVLEQANILKLNPETHQYKYIFSNYPFGMRLRETNSLLQTMSLNAAEFTKKTSSDWFFNASIANCLQKNGKAIVITTSGGAINGQDMTARKYFIENGLLQAVIALPKRMLEDTLIATNMLIISPNNDRTMLVNARNICEKGRRFNSFTDEQIEEIADAVSHETAVSKYVSKEDLREKGYIIDPNKYLTKKVSIQNGVPFASIIKSITRGTSLKADELDNLLSKEPTNFQYLMLASIRQGKIDQELPYLKEIQKNQRKYCLKNHNLILSRNGYPQKIAVAEIQNDQMILVNGNFYIIEIDEEKANPYFIKAFLESSQGTALMQSISVGTAIHIIGVDDLQNISIPMIPLEEQNVFADQYLKKAEEIDQLQEKLNTASEELNQMYDNLMRQHPESSDVETDH